jgi:diamine N-acetyltransferase
VETATKSLIELVQELPPELHAQARQGIEVLLDRYAHRDESPEPPNPGREAQVSLREITADTVRDICRLTDTLTPPKKYMVAPNAISLAQAHFEEHAWFRAIYADETPVGFAMLYENPDEEEYFLWRYMIAEPHHGKGFGRRGLELVVEHVRSQPGAKVLETSCGQGPGKPEGLYRRLGFSRNGKMLDQEVGLSLTV